MGDMADMALEAIIDAEAERSVDIDNQLRANNATLYFATAGARMPLIVGIRRYYEKHDTLSSRQRYCLARWIVENDEDPR